MPHQTYMSYTIVLFFLKFLKCFTSTFTILFQTVPYRKSGGPLCASTTCQVFYIILRNPPRDKLQTKTDELTTLKKNLCQQKMIGIWAERPMWPSFTHLKERRLLLDTLPWEIPCNLPPCLNITLPLFATKPNRGIDGDIGFLKENYESQLKIDIQFFSYTFSRILLWLRGFVDINSKAMAHFVTIL